MGNVKLFYFLFYFLVSLFFPSHFERRNRTFECQKSNPKLPFLGLNFVLFESNSFLILLIHSMAKLSIATGHAMQIYNCLNCPRQL